MGAAKRGSAAGAIARCAPLLLLAVVACWCGGAGAARHHPGEERLIGWLGETYDPGRDDAQSPAHRGRGLRVVSWDPRILHYEGFLSPEECDHLREAARPRLSMSDVADSLTGKQKIDEVRTSKGMFFSRGEDAVVSAVEQRIATMTMLPEDNAEGMQVLHYEPGQKYDPHHDYFSFAERDKNGGNRMATVLMYLTDVEEGGETVFPHVPRPQNQTRDQGWSNCSMQGFAIKPKKGDATLFWSIRPDGTFDWKSLHGSCPVIKGEKWSATKWIHVGHFATGGQEPVAVVRKIHAPSPPPAPVWCVDKRDECPTWAESGECFVNPGFMIGTREQPGSCPKSCGRCDVVPPPPSPPQLGVLQPATGGLK